MQSEVYGMTKPTTGAKTKTQVADWTESEMFGSWFKKKQYYQGCNPEKQLEICPNKLESTQHTIHAVKLHN
jgi:hypothetical protein